MTPRRPEAKPTAFEGTLRGFDLTWEVPLVDAKTLGVAPRVDELLARANGGPVGEHSDGAFEWTGSLAAHVLEVRTPELVGDLAPLSGAMAATTARLANLSAELGMALLPVAMHPWMQPHREAELWGHDLAPVYRTFDRLFDCRRHGWANVQGIRLGFAFEGPAEFGRLMRAVRAVLPWIPALAAASPFEEGRSTGILDKRLVHARHRADRIPELVGEVIPEQVYDQATYREEILQPIARHLAELDEEGALVDREWINGRGAIARFDRKTIQIGLIDAQENGVAGLAVCAAIASAVTILLEERFVGLADLGALPVAELVTQLGACVGQGEKAIIVHPRLARALGADGARDAGEVWRRVIEAEPPGDPALGAHLEHVLREGTLASRLVRAVGDPITDQNLQSVAERLVEGVRTGHSFAATAG